MTLTDFPFDAGGRVERVDTVLEPLAARQHCAFAGQDAGTHALPLVVVGGGFIGLEAAATAEDDSAITPAVAALIGALRPLSQDIAALTPRLQDVLRDRMGDLMGDRSGEGPVGAPAAPDAGMMQRLSRLVSESDGQALSLWQRHRSGFASSLPPGLFARLDDALARCDFDAASGLLHELAAEQEPTRTQEVTRP